MITGIGSARGSPLDALAGILAQRGMAGNRLPPEDYSYLFAPAPANGEPSPLWEQFGAYPGAHLGFGGFGVGGGANFTPSYGLRNSAGSASGGLPAADQLDLYAPSHSAARFASALPRLAVLRNLLSAAAVGRAVRTPVPVSPSRPSAGAAPPRRT